MKTFAEIMKKARQIRKKPVLAVAPAHDPNVLSLLPDLSPLVRPVLVGNAGLVRKRLKGLGLDQGCFEIMGEPDEAAATATASRLIKEGQAAILMEAGNDRGLFIREAYRGLHRKGAPIQSQVNVVEFSLSRKCVIVTDAEINPQPGLKDKIAILNNALVLARAMGRSAPKVAAVSAIEYVNPSIPSTMDAAVLSKMSQRGQFGNALVEGPLDIDCAVSIDACRRKGVESGVTGDADIFLVSDAESGSCFVQFLNFFGGMRTTGLVIGPPAPVILKDRYGCSDAAAAVALACLLVGGQA